MYLSIVIPAYNEALRIRHTLRSVDGYMSKKTYSYEIIVVNDGSTDTTHEVVTALQKEIPHVHLISYAPNRGKGWAVKQGMLKAQGLFRLFMDADNSTSIENIEQLFPFVHEHYDVVVGSRRVAGANIKVKQNIVRDFLGGVFRLIVRMTVPLGVIDSQNGFKLFKGQAAEEISRRQRTFTWSFDVEILAVARMLGLTLKEAPITWINDGRSHVTLKGMINMFIDVFRIRLNLWTGLYTQKVADASSLV